MKKLVGFLLVLFFMGFGGLIGGSGTASVNAATLNGWAWSETFGWIGFNSADAGAGGGSYAVSIGTSGDFSGYAWSENLGWISFNIADIPAVCSASPQAHLNSSTGQVTGWAYAMSYALSTVPADGCIELSGTNHASPTTNGTGGVTYIPSSGLFTGWAWGGDITTNTGIGWIQFDPPVTAPTTPVECLSAECGYTGVNGGITGTCSAISSNPSFTPPNQNIDPNTTVTFGAVPTGGHSPYHYQWNSEAGWDTQNPKDRFAASYSASAWGPHVVIKDKDDLLTPNISCPFVSVISPTVPSLRIGRTVSTATGSSVTVKQMNPFALVWNFTLTKDYSCSTSVNPDPYPAGYPNGNSNWKNTNLNQVSQGNTARTWSGDTGTNLTAGISDNLFAPGIYQLGISCTSNATPTPNLPQSVFTTLKVVGVSSESEI